MAVRFSKARREPRFDIDHNNWSLIVFQTFLVSGGYNGTDLSDVVAINVKNMSARTIIAESTFGFSCRNQAAVGEEGEIFALAWDKDVKVYAMHFSASASTLQSIHCFGKQQD